MEGDNFEEMTVEQLEQHLDGQGIEHKSSDRKADLIARARGQEVPDRAPSGADAGQEEVAHRLHEEQAQGYQGEVPDPTPNSAYTVGGQLAGEATPETDKGIGRTNQT